MVLAGAGVEHSALLSVAQPMLQTLPAVAAPAEPQSQYRGAHIYVPGAQRSFQLVVECWQCWKSALLPRVPASFAVCNALGSVFLRHGGGALCKRSVHQHTMRALMQSAAT